MCVPCCMLNELDERTAGLEPAERASVRQARSAELARGVPAAAAPRYGRANFADGDPRKSFSAFPLRIPQISTMNSAFSAQIIAIPPGRSRIRPTRRLTSGRIPHQCSEFTEYPTKSLKYPLPRICHCRESIAGEIHSPLRPGVLQGMYYEDDIPAAPLWNESRPVTEWDRLTFGVNGTDAGRVVKLDLGANHPSNALDIACVVPAELGRAVQVVPMKPTLKAPRN